MVLPCIHANESLRAECMTNQNWLLWSNQYELLELIINKMRASTCDTPPPPLKKALCLLSITALIKSDWSLFPNFIHSSKLKLAVCSSVTCNGWFRHQDNSLSLDDYFVVPLMLLLESGQWNWSSSTGRTNRSLWAEWLQMRSGCVALLWLPGLAITWVWSYIRTYVHTHYYEG